MKINLTTGQVETLLYALNLAWESLDDDVDAMGHDKDFVDEVRVWKKEMANIEKLQDKMLALKREGK